MPEGKIYPFSNIFGVRFSDNDVVLHFGFDEAPDKPGQQVADQAAIVMTPRSAKMLAAVLNKTISAFEAENGEIFVPPGKLAGIDAAVEAGHRRRQKE